MTADHHVETLTYDGAQRLDQVAQIAAGAPPTILNIRRSFRRLGERDARKCDDLGVRGIARQRREKVAIELSNPSPRPERFR